MSYDKQTWETGEVITASKLNHMEDGIAESGSGSGGGVFKIGYIEVSEDINRFDKTVGEIMDAYNSGKSLWIVNNLTHELLPFFYYGKNDYDKWIFSYDEFEAEANSEAELRELYPQQVSIG